MKRALTVASVVLFLMALAVFGIALRQNRMLRRQLTAKLSSSDRFYVGDKLDRLQVTDMQAAAGERAARREDDRPVARDGGGHASDRRADGHRAGDVFARTCASLPYCG